MLLCLETVSDAMGLEHLIVAIIQIKKNNNSLLLLKHPCGTHYFILVMDKELFLKATVGMDCRICPATNTPCAFLGEQLQLSL